MLELENLRFARADFSLDVSLSLDAGERGVVLGASGSGKTTLLRLIAGFLEPDSGSIRKRGRELRGLAPEKRGIGMVFQEDALFPAMTASENIEYGLKLSGMSRPRRRERAEELAARMGIAALLDRRPRELSGGERQRVALARSLAVGPDILLFDEALAALDPRTKEMIEETIADLARQSGLTSLHVTHDVGEALASADRIFLIEGGRLVETGRPEDLYERPARASTARWFASGPLIALDDSPSVLARVAKAAHEHPRDPGNAGRPRHAHFPASDARLFEGDGEVRAGFLALSVVVEHLVYRGSHVEAELLIEGTDARFRKDFLRGEDIRPGLRVHLEIPEASVGGIAD